MGGDAAEGILAVSATYVGADDLRVFISPLIHSKNPGCLLCARYLA